MAEALVWAERTMPPGPDRLKVYRKMLAILQDPLGQSNGLMSIKHQNGTLPSSTFHKAYASNKYRVFYRLDGGKVVWVGAGHRNELYQGTGMTN